LVQPNALDREAKLGVAERINIRHAGQDVEVSELLPAQAAQNVIPVSLAGFVLEEYTVPPVEQTKKELKENNHDEDRKYLFGELAQRVLRIGMVFDRRAIRHVPIRCIRSIGGGEFEPE